MNPEHSRMEAFFVFFFRRLAFWRLIPCLVTGFVNHITHHKLGTYGAWGRTQLVMADEPLIVSVGGSMGAAEWLRYFGTGAPAASAGDCGLGGSFASREAPETPAVQRGQGWAFWGQDGEDREMPGWYMLVYVYIYICILYI